MKTVFLTGATGAMGGEGLKCLLKERDKFRVKVLARPSAKNQKKLDSLEKEGLIEVVWGNLTNYEDVKRGVDGADYVLHVGGMVSPLADHYPEKTIYVNTESTRNIVRAIKAQENPDSVRLVYIGSVAQLGNRLLPKQWGGAGDPVWPAKFDAYAVSKIEGEKIVAESGLKYWVSFRQTGMLSHNLLGKASDPITFHVPITGVLEWVSDKDSGRLLAAVCERELPDDFWCRFYNVGGGESYRITNYEFMYKLLRALYCPAPEKIFRSDWFALRNFHGMWYTDSDKLDDILHYRSGQTFDEYLDEFRHGLPFYFRFARIVPAWIMRKFMEYVANKKPLGPLYWRKHGDEARINAFFYNRERMAEIPDWKDIDLSHPENSPVKIDKGFDESIADEDIDYQTVCEAAKFRGGECVSESMKTGDMVTALKWKCHRGHTFEASPRLILRGGHWCPGCFNGKSDYDEEEATRNRFFHQVYK